MEMMIGAVGILPKSGIAGPDAMAQTGGRMPAARDAAAARKVAKEFESLFVGMMLKSMRETTGKDKLTDGGHGEEVYRSLLDQEYAKALTERGGVGLASMLEQQLLRPQSMSNYDNTNPQAKTEVNHENR